MFSHIYNSYHLQQFKQLTRYSLPFSDSTPKLLQHRAYLSRTGREWDKNLRSVKNYAMSGRLDCILCLVSVAFCVGFRSLIIEDWKSSLLLVCVHSFISE